MFKSHHQQLKVFGGKCSSEDAAGGTYLGEPQRIPPLGYQNHGATLLLVGALYLPIPKSADCG